MRDYDSAFLSQVRNLEREIASGRQELIGLRRDSRLPDALQELESEADGHSVRLRAFAVKYAKSARRSQTAIT
jgi:hypothetical protein